MCIGYGGKEKGCTGCSRGEFSPIKYGEGIGECNPGKENKR